MHGGATTIRLWPMAALRPVLQKAQAAPWSRNVQGLANDIKVLRRLSGRGQTAAECQEDHIREVRWLLLSIILF